MIGGEIKALAALVIVPPNSAAVRLDPSALLGMMGCWLLLYFSAAVRLDPSALLVMMGI